MIQVLINGQDRTESIVVDSFETKQNLTNQVDTANFQVKKYGDRTFVPHYDDEVEIFDGLEKVFGGRVLIVSEKVDGNVDSVLYDVNCVDYTYEMDKLLVSRVYENETISDIIDDLLISYAPDFSPVNITSTFLIEKIVFNQVPISTCLKRLANIVRYDWYVDPDRGVHFFAKETNNAPYNLTDISGNYIYKSLERNLDGSQVVNRVKVRGGEYDGELFTDEITVSGNVTSSFKLPYRFANLRVWLDTGLGYVEQSVGIELNDDFDTKDVLHYFQEATIRFETPLSNGNKIKFQGNPKVRVFAIAEDSASIQAYGKIEKLIREPEIQSNTLARRRANAELYAYASSVVEAKFVTYEPGLRTGMLLNVSSVNRNFSDDLIIKSITFKPIDPLNFGYVVECISSKRHDLLDILQKILEPEALPIDEVEVAEEIFTDTQIINITEEYEIVAPVEANETVSISENILLNPISPASLRYVWGYYAPTSQSDTKRMGRWNRGAKWQ